MRRASGHRECVVGLISDTHGLLRPQAVAALRGVQRIIHAGDIGAPEVLAALEDIAPVTAMRGNNDREAWARRLPERNVLEVNDARIYIVHDVHTLGVDPKTAGIAAVISGHSHRPTVIERDGVLFVNPGSAGPRRFNLPVALARLHITAGHVRANLLLLAV